MLIPIVIQHCPKYEITIVARFGRTIAISTLASLLRDSAPGLYCSPKLSRLRANNRHSDRRGHSSSEYPCYHHNNSLLR